MAAGDSTDWGNLSDTPTTPATSAPTQAAAPSHVPGLSLDQHLKIFGKQQIAKPWYKSLQDLAAVPAEGLANVFGAQERFVTGMSNYMYAHPEEAKKHLMAGAAGPFALIDPEYRKAAAQGIKAVMNPNDPSYEAESEKALNVDKLMSHDPRFRGKLQNFFVETIFQGLKDPTTYETAGIAPLAEGLLRGADILTRAAMVSRNPALRVATRMLSTNVPEKIAQTEAAVQEAQRAGTFTSTRAAIGQTIDESRKAISAVNTARNKGLSAMRKLSDTDEALITKHRDALKQVPQGDYTIHTEPPPELIPSGVARPTTKAYNPNFKWPIDEIEQRLNLARPDAYKLPSKIWEGSDAESILREQLKQSREMIRSQVVRDQLRENLKGMSDREVRALVEAHDPSRAMPTTQDILKNIAEKEPETAGPSLARSISDAQIDAMLATGVPHMRNITVAALMSMPPQDVAKALVWAITNTTPKALIDRIEQGAASHFGLESARSPITRGLESVGVGKVKPFRAFRHGSGVALDKLDQAYRAASLARADKTMAGAQEFEKLDRVNQDIGAYGMKPTWTSYAPVIGANFPQWHGYIVPTMFARAALRRPGALATMGRAETNFNDAVFGDKRYRATLGGPADEGMSAYLDPLRVLPLGKYPTYFGGQSTAGALSTVLRPSYVPFPERIAQYLMGFVPFGNIAADALIDKQFPEVNTLPQALATGSGVYLQKRTPSSYRRGMRPLPIPQPLPSGATASANAHDSTDWGSL